MARDSRIDNLGRSHKAVCLKSEPGWPTRPRQQQESLVGTLLPGRLLYPWEPLTRDGLGRFDGDQNGGLFMLRVEDHVAHVLA